MSIESSSALSEEKSSNVEANDPVSASDPSYYFIEVTGTKTAPDPEKWHLHLVNLSHPLPDDYAPELALIESTGYLYYSAQAISYLDAMLDAAINDGVSIFVTSAYRSMSYQQAIYDEEIEYYLNEGYGLVEATNIASSLVAVPGTSEHQLGLATDIVSPDHPWLYESFEDTTAFAWLDENAHKFGFILRFPKDKTEITRIAYEPWHYRFVGEEDAIKIKQLGLCLEEYLDLIP